MRLRLLDHLTTGEHRVRDLVDHLGLGQSTVSQHLRFLAGCGLVEVPTLRYSLANADRLSELWAAAQELLDAVGSHGSRSGHR